MKRNYAAIFALSAVLFMPAASWAAMLPANTGGAPNSGVILTGDGDEARHWRSYPGAAWDIPSGLGDRFDLRIYRPLVQPRGFALQAPMVEEEPPVYEPEPPRVTVAPEGQVQY